MPKKIYQIPITEDTAYVGNCFSDVAGYRDFGPFSLDINKRQRLDDGNYKVEGVWRDHFGEAPVEGIIGSIHIDLKKGLYTKFTSEEKPPYNGDMWIKGNVYGQGFKAKARTGPLGRLEYNLNMHEFFFRQ